MTEKGTASRTEYAAKNFLWSTVGSIVQALLGFVSRTVFIFTLGTAYLGLSGLFTNVLGMLSLAELGVGTAISFSLYKPLAQSDTEKVWAYISFFKKAYRLVAAVVAILGLALIPFLKYIIKGTDGIEHITLMYCIYLFNTVTSYLISYRATVLSADQKNYLQANITTVFNIITVAVQTVFLIATKNYIIYLIIQAVIQLASRFYLDYYTKKLYPYLKSRTGSDLSGEEKRVVYKKIRALIVHKIGDVSINQTDNIIISSFISTVTVGLVSNFTMIISLTNMFVNSFFTSAVAGLGNIISTESEGRRLEVFKKYDFLGFWFYGWTGICLYFLLTPFVTLWIGGDKLVDAATVALLCCNYYLTGQRIPLSNVKIAAGVYEQDVWLPFAQAAVNLAVSVIGAITLGLKGVFIGTLVSSMIPNLLRPYIVYRHVFHQSPAAYYAEYFKRILIIGVNVGLISALIRLVHTENAVVSLIYPAVLCAVIPNVLIILIYRKTEELAYVKHMARAAVNRILKK